MMDVVVWQSSLPPRRTLIPSQNQYPEYFMPCISVHPYREDAIAELGAVCPLFFAYSQGT